LFNTPRQRKAPRARREAAQKLIAGGMSQRQAAKVLGVSHTTVQADVADNLPKSGKQSATGKPETKARRAIPCFTFTNCKTRLAARTLGGSTPCQENRTRRSRRDCASLKPQAGFHTGNSPMPSASSRAKPATTPTAKSQSRRKAFGASPATNRAVRALCAFGRLRCWRLCRRRFDLRQGAQRIGLINRQTGINESLAKRRSFGLVEVIAAVACCARASAHWRTFPGF
jgi:helix-turn-helix, Psq domain